MESTHTQTNRRVTVLGRVILQVLFNIYTSRPRHWKGCVMFGKYLSHVSMKRQCSISSLGPPCTGKDLLFFSLSLFLTPLILPSSYLTRKPRHLAGTARVNEMYLPCNICRLLGDMAIDFRMDSIICARAAFLGPPQ